MQTHNKSKKDIFIIIAVIVMVSLCFFTFRYYSANRNQTVAGGPTAAELKKQAEVDANNKMSYTSDPKNSEDPIYDTTDNPTPTYNLSLNGEQDSNGSVTFKTKLPGVSSGNCYLKVTNGAKTIAKTAPIIYQSEFSTCGGFSIPISELGVGAWKANLVITGSNSGEANTSIEVK